ncbi:MAG: hypothetical protein SAK29_31870 [Scytonema sp. PMC 1069.18]|nr:hypothetical protein [Scytonema sp. PMC 1069.18]MEC4884352.1 hypothetical protein [Scytonema sp. PMC 1070.18]
MDVLIDIAGIGTLGTIGAVTVVIASAINPVGAGLVIAGVILWVRELDKPEFDIRKRVKPGRSKLYSHIKLLHGLSISFGK